MLHGRHPLTIVQHTFHYHLERKPPSVPPSHRTETGQETTEGTSQIIFLRLYVHIPHNCFSAFFFDLSFSIFSYYLHVHLMGHILSFHLCNLLSVIIRFVDLSTFPLSVSGRKQSPIDFHQFVFATLSSCCVKSKRHKPFFTELIALLTYFTRTKAS